MQTMATASRPSPTERLGLARGRRGSSNASAAATVQLDMTLANGSFGATPMPMPTVTSHLLQRCQSQFWSEVDAGSAGVGAVTGTQNYTIAYLEIASTALSMIMRAVAVGINMRLAYDYYAQGQHNYFAWTVICMVVPMIITTLLHVNMYYQDGLLSKGTCRSLCALGHVVPSFFFRYWKSLVYSVKCKRAQLCGDKEAQLRYYKLYIREESDVTFIRIFECFLEAAPQKILQISIVLTQPDKMSDIQIIAICSYFGNMAWCLSAYHRYNRYSQADKHKINIPGFVLQLCWHFCISVSRTLCIAFVASIFAWPTIIACLCHAFLFGWVTFVVDRPQFAALPFFNFLFCLVVGIVYLFTYFAVKDEPTRCKYIVYYTICSCENIVCVVFFMLYASDDLRAVSFLFYPLCAVSFAFYFIGIVFMMIYYMYFHPKIIARNSKSIPNHN